MLRLPLCEDVTMLDPRSLVAGRTERGAAAVEFALVLPMLLTLLLGTTTAGLAYSRSNATTNAVREGARFGATTDASAAAAAAWADATIARVQETLFDGTGGAATVCVQLWKVGTGELANTGKCSSTSGGPVLARPTTATAAPAVPSNAAGTCVVRVLAARPFSIDTGFFRWDNTMVLGSVARYERKDKVPSCL